MDGFPEIATMALILAAQIAAGVLFADLMSGVFHWYIDTYGDPRTPVLGRWIFTPNIDHHAEPLKCARSPLLKRNGPVWALTALFGLGFWTVGWLNAFGVSALVAGALANEIHILSHQPRRRRPAWVQALQKSGLFLSPKQHWRHHSGAYDKRYCTITDLLNPVLDHLRVFRILEGLIEGLGRLRPRDEILSLGVVRRGRRALSMARRVVAAAGWRFRRFVNPAPVYA